MIYPWEIIELCYVWDHWDKHDYWDYDKLYDGSIRDK